MNQNPYQQNIDILKGFFRKPIVLVTAIVEFIAVAANFIVSVSGVTKNLIYDLSSAADYYDDRLISSTNNIPSIGIAGILAAVSLLLLFISSRKADGTLTVGSTMFKVVSIIQLVGVCILSALLLALMGILAVMILLPFGGLILLILPFFIITIALLLITGISQVLFANSIKSSTNTIFLKRTGAKLYGIISIIIFVLAVVFMIFINIIFISSEVISTALIAFDVVAALSFADSLLTGIFAIGYSNYIRDVSKRFVTEAEPQAVVDETYQVDPQPYQNVQGVTPVQPYAPEAPAQQAVFCSNCGQQLNPEDYFCNNCGTPVKK